MTSWPVRQINKRYLFSSCSFFLYDHDKAVVSNHCWFNREKNKNIHDHTRCVILFPSFNCALFSVFLFTRQHFFFFSLTTKTPFFDIPLFSYICFFFLSSSDNTTEEHTERKKSGRVIRSILFSSMLFFCCCLTRIYSGSLLIEHMLI